MRDRFHHLLGLGDAGADGLPLRLDDALGLPGCPVCRIAAEGALRRQMVLLYDRGDDLLARREVLASRGFCTEHTWTLPLVARAVQDDTLVMTTGERLIAETLRHADDAAALERWLRPEAPCPACAAGAAATAAGLAALARRFPDWPDDPAGWPDTICLTHLAGAARLVGTDEHGILTAARLALVAGGRMHARITWLAGAPPDGAPPLRATCPVCRAVNRAADATPDVTALCRRHAWSLFARGRHDVAGALRDCVEPARCPACRIAARAAEAATADLADGADLCLGHLRLALARGRPVYESAFASLVRLGRDLRHFREDPAYRVSGLIDKGEGSTWWRALARLGGESVGVDRS
ncbi:MAG TPA: hypothetical protein VFL91_05330 [Thermomicrobiales bacterium]|nr:hypothetical protein [Thermomicrobiales bacterium]